MKDLFILKEHTFNLINKEVAENHPEVVPRHLWIKCEELKKAFPYFKTSLIEHLGKLYILISNDFINPLSKGWSHYIPAFPEEATEKLIKQLILEYGITVKDKILNGETYLGFNTGIDNDHEILFLYPIEVDLEVIKKEIYQLPSYSNEKLRFATLLYLAMKEAEKGQIKF